MFLRTLDAGANELVSCRNRNCAAPDGTQAFSPAVRVVPAKAGTLCLPADHPSGCVLIAFTTDDATITGKTDFNDQIIVAVASAPAQPGDAAGPAGGFTVASVRPNGMNGSSNSTEPAWDADGSALAFVSRARDLATDGLTGLTRGLYVRHFDSGTTEFASKSGTTPSADVGGTAIGGNAQHLRVAWDATGSFDDAREQVWVRDLTTPSTALLNRAAGPGGAVGDDDAIFGPALSEDGSTALFGTKATNIGEHPGDRFTHVYTRGLDAPGEPVSLVSRPSGTDPLPTPGNASFLGGPGAVSADGRYVVFGSLERLTPDAPPGINSVYVRDGLTGRTALVSRADGPDGAAAITGSNVGGISADGRRILFSTDAANVLPAGVQGQQAFVRDLDSGTTTLVSRADGPDGRPGVDAFAASISADGNAVLFETRSPLDPAGGDGELHLYVRNLATGTTTLVDRDSGVNGTVPTESAFAGTGSLDADGSRVTWESRAAIAGAPADGNDHIFLRDLPSHVTTLVSRADGPDGAPADASSFEAAIDASGQHVVFASEGRNLGVTFDGLQVFVRDVDAGRTETIGQPGGDAAPFPNASLPSIDASGQRVAFAASTDPQEHGVYVRDRSTQTTELVSRADGPDGAPAFDLSDSDTAISPDGNCVAFDGDFTGLGDGLSSADFGAVHLRTVGSDCPNRPAPPRPPAPPGPVPHPGTPPAAKPKLSRLSVSPSRFWTAGKRRGTTVRYTLSKKAKVTVRIDLVRGHRVKRIGTVTLSGRSGANRWKFTGKIKGKTLARASYRLTAKPASGAGHSARFKVIQRTEAPLSQRRPRW